ncbi:acyl-CoA dehydrogenase [Williamsia limnetica]|uniref:Acyl-CoA dehydrogenase n=1 Tax=Williamsia limnetica TaxID=882452 RepID=A0A318RSI4_WILLI|nr:acyl-CoA dehydrogenase family protein [Williamsia limnetica]PYE20226.1 acyl-CoA dehydrogenase [Williamsia limnetica]
MTESSLAGSTGAELDYEKVVIVAAAAAHEVDRDARFPHEAVAAMRDNGLLSCSLPTALGGRSTSISDLATMARALGAGCSSAAMVFAMHHTQALSLRWHGAQGDIAELTRTIAAEGALLASATTEISTGGDVRSSGCAVISDGAEVVLEKNAPVISYGEYADYICATARRGPDSPPSDQVLIVCPRSDIELEKTGTWDVLGFRGTCSPGFILRARTVPSNVLPVDYGTISSHTMLPSSHTLWASVWLGIADAAVSKARVQVRAAARRNGGGATDRTAAFADLLVIHQRFEASVAQEIRRYEDFLASGELETTVGFAIALNNLKLAASQAVVDVVSAALAMTGINAYREDHVASMGRLLRDAFGPQLMVSNERIRANNAQLVLAYRGR